MADTPSVLRSVSVPAALAYGEPAPAATRLLEALPEAVETASSERAPTPPHAPSPTPVAAAAVEAGEAAADKPRVPVAPAPRPRVRPVRREPEEQPDLGLGSPGEGEPALSTDGATRLLVTAYIGIGNRVHIRGEGPGLSWTQGVPLQFVSIGRWRWETTDATAAVRFKLFKNDQVECTALGERQVEAGRQLEVSASF